MEAAPDSRQPRRSQDRPDPSRQSGASPDGTDDARLLAGEQARIDQAVILVAPGGGRPLLVAALIVVAFLVGLVRPWDWLAGDPGAAAGRGGVVPGATAGTGEGMGGGINPGMDGGPLSTALPGDTAGEAPFQAPTCGYPTAWRTAVISFWAGARARVWTAAEAVPATGPADPSIPFQPVASDRVEAMGWCAPVSGPERPPLDAAGTLFRVRDGVATPVAVDRLEPPAPDALGELWVPPAQSADGRPPWAPGRYVVRLATPTGTYARYLGLEVGTGDTAPTPSAGPAGSAPVTSPTR